MNKDQIFSKENTFNLIVLAACIVNLGMQFITFNIPSTILSIIGIIGVVMRLNDNKAGKTFILIWVWAQLIVIPGRSTDFGGWTLIHDGIWDPSQVASYNIAILNIVPFVYLVAMNLLDTKALIGKKLEFRQLRQDSPLAEVYPLQGTVKQLVTIINDKDWLLVELDQPFALEQKPVQHIIVKRKDGEPVKKGEPRQIVFVLMVNDLLDIREDYNRRETFPFLDWAICR